MRGLDAADVSKRPADDGAATGAEASAGGPAAAGGKRSKQTYGVLAPPLPWENTPVAKTTMVSALASALDPDAKKATGFFDKWPTSVVSVGFVRRAISSLPPHLEFALL